MKKSELRKKYKKARAGFSDLAVEEKSLAIANQSLKLPVWDKSVYSIFLSIKRHKEVETEFLLNILFGKDKDVVVSRSEFETLKMYHYLLTDQTKIVINDWGIPEPEGGIEVPAEKIDVVFVPLLAFDLQGNRVGYGKGFYDQFLASCRPETIKVGMSFFEAEERIADTHSGDIRLDYCVTPERIYNF